LLFHIVLHLGLNVLCFGFVGLLDDAAGKYYLVVYHFYCVGNFVYEQDCIFLPAKKFELDKPDKRISHGLVKLIIVMPINRIKRTRKTTLFR